MADHRPGRSLNEHLLLPPPPSSACVVAINGKKRSKYVVFWALEKYIPEGVTDFKLVYVCPPITYVPTPMGNTIPISEVRDDVASAYRQEMEWNISEMLRPYIKMCERRKVLAEVLLLDSDDTAAAIAEEITRSGIDKLVIGLSLRGFFSRKLDMSSMIAAATPSFCTVYVISKMKLASVRPSECETYGPIKCEGIERSSSTSGSTGDNPGLHSEFQDLLTFPPEAQSRGPPPLPSLKQSTPLVRMDTSSTDTDHSMEMPVDNHEGFNQSEIYLTQSWGSRWPDLDERREIMSSSSSNNREILNMDWSTAIQDNNSWVSHQASNMSDGLFSAHSATENQASLSFQIKKLKAELKHVQEIYAMAQTETAGASRKLEELNQRRFEEWERLEELRAKEEEAKEAAAEEKQRYENAVKEAEKVREVMAKEALKRREVEIKENLKLTLTMETLQYQHFTWEEILAATANFSADLKIGMGAYGTVYKCNLHHTIAAVKVLHAGETQLSKQFDQEVKILSKIRHPHLVLLLGACPEQGCLVYEYMDNGSLEDCLMLVNDRSPIPWFDRFRIAWEVASALIFLHKSKPKPIIHRDLKPGNILLDHNFVSKLGDVGLSTMVNQDDPASKLTIYKKTSPVGTLCYIDPEYQRTGMISTKADVYSLGIVILQLITAKPAIAITQMMEDAIADDVEFMEVLDAKAGSWPINETRELAALGLCCTELRRRDRPDLKDQILPVLERLKKFAEKATQSSLLKAPTSPPSHFICPLLKDVMKEPCVAADGYTYDRKCIEEWFRDHNTSPVTNLPLPNKNLLPNYTLNTAIMEWKSNKK